MIYEVYDALKSAGAPEDKAKAAAEALGNYENRFNKIETELTLLNMDGRRKYRFNSNRYWNCRQNRQTLVKNRVMLPGNLMKSA
jgi:hypothetical protein